MSNLPDKVSESFKRLNPEIYEPNTTPESDGENTKLECNSLTPPLGKNKAKKGDSAKFSVRVTSFRHRLLDEDNICAKYHVDLCRYAGILPSDAPATTRIQATQEKIRSEEKEYTLIEIEKL
jgi:hypothetical protein